MNNIYCLILLFSVALSLHSSDAHSSDAVILNLNCRKGDLENVKNLILEKQVEENYYTLIEAASSGNLELVMFLVEDRGLVPGITTLRTAASFGNLNVVRYVL